MIYRSFVFFFFLIIRHPPRSTRTDPLFPYTTLFRSEVVRGALLAIPKGHREAGLALGLGKPRIFTRLILPQMWRLALPGLGNLFMILMKDTALVSVIGLEEIMRRSQIAVTASKEPRSEERRVGTECVCTCRSRWSPSH